MADTKTPPSGPGAFDQRLYNHETKQWENHSPEDALELVKAGKRTYESGVRVPVVAPDGSTGSIASEEAYTAFSEGFRPLTAGIQSQATRQAERQIDEKHYGNRAVDAAIAGALRGATFGASDVAFNALGLEDGANKLRDLNSGASLVGEVAGGIVTALAGPLAAGAKVVGAGGKAAATALGASKAGRAAAKATTTALGKSRAGTLGRAAVKAAEQVTEGAYFGLGTGISEAALGPPDQVVDALVSNVGLGGLLGGATSGLFSVGGELVKPTFDKLVSRTATGAAGIVDQAARKVLRVGGAVLDEHGVEGARKLAGDLADDPEYLKWVVAQGGTKNVEKMVKDFEPIVRSAEKEAKSIERDLASHAKRMPQEARESLNEYVERNGKNVYEAGKMAERDLDALGGNLRTLFASQAEVPVTTNLNSIREHLQDVVEEIASAKSPQALNIAEKIAAMDALVPGIKSQANEANFLLDLVEELGPLTRTANVPRAKAIRDVFNMAEESLLTHPNAMISETYATFRNQRTALEALRKTADDSLSRLTAGTRIFDKNKAARTLINPESRATVEAVLNNFEQFGPEYKRYQELLNSKDIQAKAALLRQLEDKVKTLTPGRVNAQEALDVLSLAGKRSDFDSKVARLDELKAMLEPGASPLDKMIRITQAMGESTAELEKIAKNLPALQVFDKLGEIGAPSLSASKAFIGGSIGGVAGLLYSIGTSNVQNYVKGIATLQSAANKGAQLMSEGVKVATKALTSDRAMRAAAKATTIVGTKASSIQDQRAKYNKAKETLSAAIAQPMALRSEAPQISQALQAKQNQALTFLQSKLPLDPLEATAINPDKTGYVPPDYEVRAFNRYVEAVNNPLSVLDSIAKGRISREGVETLKTLYPRIYEDLQNSVMQSMIDRGGKVSYQQRIELGLLFDIPTDYSLQPEFIKAMQFEINQTEGGRPEGSGRKPSLNIDPSTVATPTTLLTNKV